ncbi:uncharacterized protein [Parasteatoda tepidariorum]|uniref:uncharacterized protein n=1 Tax=Parasteatoda tepidariorum TaxID=114398 RepID=UPI00077F8F06|nr:uncharacterized protein LOC122268965 [Parasteatoda tepidariorum]
MRHSVAARGHDSCKKRNARQMNHQMHCVMYGYMGKNATKREFECGMIVDVRSFGTSIIEIAALKKCSRAAVINVYREWTTKQKTGSQRQGCGRHRQLNARAERRLSRVVKPNRRATVSLIVRNSNEGATANVSDRPFHHTLHSIGYGSRRPV